MSETKISQLFFETLDTGAPYMSLARAGATHAPQTWGRTWMSLSGLSTFMLAGHSNDDEFRRAKQRLAR